MRNAVIENKKSDHRGKEGVRPSEKRGEGRENKIGTKKE